MEFTQGEFILALCEAELANEMRAGAGFRTNQMNLDSEAAGYARTSSAPSLLLHGRDLRSGGGPSRISTDGV
jgi:hypothetical protein